LISEPQLNFISVTNFILREKVQSLRSHAASRFVYRALTQGRNDCVKLNLLGCSILPVIVT